MIKCFKCTKAVYKVEEVNALDRIWHKTCFTCGSTTGQGCGRVLPAGQYSDHEHEPFCNACYNKNFKKKSSTAGYGTVVAVKEKESKMSTAPVPSPNMKNLSPKFMSANIIRCCICTKAVYKVEEVNALNKIWHKTCFTCGAGAGNVNATGSSSNIGCGKVLVAGQYCDRDNDPFCTACYNKNFKPKGIGYGTALGDTGISISSIIITDNTITAAAIEPLPSLPSVLVTPTISIPFPSSTATSSDTTTGIGINVKDNTITAAAIEPLPSLPSELVLISPPIPLSTVPLSDMVGNSSNSTNKDTNQTLSSSLSIVTSIDTIIADTSAISPISISSSQQLLSSPLININNNTHDNNNNNNNNNNISDTSSNKNTVTMILNDTTTTPTTIPISTIPILPIPSPITKSLSSSKFTSPVNIIRCCICTKAVYKVEEVNALNKIWHKTCFTCGAGTGNVNATGSSSSIGCGKVLVAGQYCDRDNDPFCTACYNKNFKTKGISSGYGTTATATTLSDSSTGIGINIKDNTIIAAAIEPLPSLPSVLVAPTISIPFPSSTAPVSDMEGNNNNNSSATTTTKIEINQSPSPSLSSSLYADSIRTTPAITPLMNAVNNDTDNDNINNNNTTSDTPSNTNTVTMILNDTFTDTQNNFTINNIVETLPIPIPIPILPSPPSQITKNLSSKFISVNMIRCCICTKAVYKVEEVNALNKIWHKTCFTCGTGNVNATGSSSNIGCGKVLVAGQYCDRDNDPFCTACYNKNFKNNTSIVSTSTLSLAGIENEDVEEI
eukprot:gene10832-22601_t